MAEEHLESVKAATEPGKSHPPANLGLLLCGCGIWLAWGHTASQGRWRRQRKPEHAARWAWSHVSFQRIPREPGRTWLLSQALDGCRAQFGRNISALGDSRCWVGLKVIDGAVISRRKCRMRVSAGLLKPMLILAWGRQVHTPVLACMLPYACVQEAHADMGGQRAHLLPNLTPTFFPRGVLA